MKMRDLAECAYREKDSKACSQRGQGIVKIKVTVQTYKWF